MRKIPFLGPCVALIIGILAAEHGAGFTLAAWIGAVALLLLVISSFVNLSQNHYEVDLEKCRCED